MHEHSLMQNILEGVQGELKTRGITRPGTIEAFHLTLGALEIHSLESFEQAFTVAIKGTPLEGADLVLTITPASIACAACGFRGAVAEGEADPHASLPIAECPKCGTVAAVEGGRGVGPMELILSEA
jgi:Zn finger protein HypA/HybF involved in hydrogenase expression